MHKFVKKLLINLSLFISSLLLSLIIGEMTAQFIVSENILDEYKKNLSPTEISNQNSTDSLNKDLYKINRHLTNINDQPKTPHPYFGYVYNRALNDKINRQGFRDERDFEEKKKENEFIIGVFGGSVAKNFSLYEKNRSNNNLEWLGSRLSKLKNTAFYNKNIVIYNMALSAGKQPQQFFISSMLNTNLDMAINIDGYNEADRENTFVFPSIFPAYANLFYSLSPSRQEYWLHLLNLRQQEIFITTSILNNHLLNHSKLIYFIWSSYLKINRQKMLELQTSHNNEIDNKYAYYQDGLTSAQQRDISNEIWVKYSRLQYLAQKNLNIPSYFFLQPNQYIKKSKPFSKEELEHFVINTQDTRDISERYLKIIRSAQKLQSENLPFFDLTQIFKNTTETVYEDSCCHLNSYGNSVMEDAIFSILTKK